MARRESRAKALSRCRALLRSAVPVERTLRMTLKAHIRLFVVLLFLFIPSMPAFAQDGCMSYEPEPVKLKGTISRKTFPGPPNYESIRKGDEPETYWILHPLKPICTIASEDNDAEKGVRDIQLILTPKQYISYKKLVGQRIPVTLSGKLSHAITGHHHTPVLMEVVDISSSTRPKVFR
jgi:hypothetical protein